MTEEEIKKLKEDNEKLKQEKEEAIAKFTALEQENKDLKSKNEELVKTSDEMRLLNGKLLLKQVHEDKDDETDKEDDKTQKSLEETVLDILNKKE